MITMSAILTVLYGASGFISLAGYLPQYLAFRKDPDACRTTPPTTWLLWFVQSLIVAIYAVTINGDKMFMMAALLALTAVTVCTTALLYGRWKVQRAEEAKTSIVKFPVAVVPPTPHGGAPTPKLAA